MPGLEKDIELAATEARDALDEYVDRVLDALGRPGALATDESRVSEFLSFLGRDHKESLVRGREGRKGPWIDVPADAEARRENEERLRACQEALRVPVAESDLIVDVARRLRALARRCPRFRVTDCTLIRWAVFPRSRSQIG